MKSLTTEQYIEILKNYEIRGTYSDNVDMMRRWDETRTAINPNAKWYSLVEEAEKQTEVIETDAYIKRDLVVSALVEVAKSKFASYGKSQETIEALIEAEDIIKMLPSVEIEKEVKKENVND